MQRALFLLMVACFALASCKDVNLGADGVDAGGGKGGSGSGGATGSGGASNSVAGTTGTGGTISSGGIASSGGVAGTGGSTRTGGTTGVTGGTTSSAPNCAMLGCSQPPLCSEGCTAPCGCCPCTTGTRSGDLICTKNGCYDWAVAPDAAGLDQAVDTPQADAPRGGAGGSGGTTGTGGSTRTGGTTGSGGTTASPVDAGANSCNNPLPLQCGDLLNHSTLIQGRANVWSGYNCSQRAESGREAVYAFQTAASCQVAVQLKNLTLDLDLFVLTGCSPGRYDKCSSTPLDLQTIETVNFTSQAGQPYFVVVDGYSDAAGTYTLQVDCTCNPDAGTSDAPRTDASGRSYQGIFVPTGSMAVGREYHTATLLPDGKVLIAGGWVHSAGDDTAEVASAELYDPGTGTFTATGSMNFAREGHTATLLANGLVLITGGVNYQGWPASAELYDPGTGIFTTTGSLNFARGGHTATLLANGLVLIAGGYNGAVPGTPQPTDPDAGFFYTGTFPATAELYDPGTGTFTATGSLNAARDGHTATLLPNGTVLITGGGDSFSYLRRLASAELYDPGAGTFTATASMAVPRALHTATLLPNGMVLIAGGDNGALANAELFDPRVGTFTSTGGMADSRSNHTATLLPSGTVLVAGGVGIGSVFASAELYDPGTRRFVATGSMTGTRTLHKATLLQDGMVLIAGGVYGGSGGGWSASAELYE